MIRHTVLFQFKANASKEAIDHAFSLLCSLQKQIPGFLRIACGKCRFHENHGGIDRLYGFSIDFANEESYNKFLNDSITMPAKNAIINLIDNGYDGIFGFDTGRTFDSTPNPLDRYRTLVPRLLPPGAMR